MVEKNIYIHKTKNTVPIKVEEIDGEHIITIDGIEWVRTTNMVHAAVLFNMMHDHITDYIQYDKII